MSQELFSIGFVDVTLLDVVDIAIVTAIFYRLYQSLRNTVTFQVIAGVLVVMGLYLFTTAFDIRALNWLLGSLSDIWLIAFIILFQPEIRRLLIPLLRAPLFNFFAKTDITETIDEVLDAVREMSEKHTGALIVFSRDRNVTISTDTGVTIQGQLTKELLISIFNVKSPLHDGAVIVQNGHVQAAGCILPLSLTTRLENQNLGTRHRAALGISEQADVLALVVSEESGFISVAEEGRLIRGLTLDQLEEQLRESLTLENPQRERQLFSFGSS